MPIQNHIVIGGGSWGAAIADQLRRADQSVTLLVRSTQTAENLARGYIQQLPDISPISPLDATTDLTILSQADLIHIVVPIFAHSEVISHIKQYARKGTPISLASKGLLPDTQKGALFLPEWLDEVASDFPFTMLSGPSFADEVISGKPAALVAASLDKNLTQAVATSFQGSNLRVYSSTDPLGVALGGALKNVIAIAAGIATGLKLGDNARAALITRGLAEMQRLADAVGADTRTLSGLSGMGDLMLSCAGPHSRNMAYGLALGSGQTPNNKLSEGRYAAALVAARAKSEGVDMPLCQSIDHILNHGQDLQNTLTTLLSRQAGAE